jgi:hypothetical protein
MRLYKTGDSWKIGIFATELTLMPMLVTRNPKTFKQSSTIVISAGDELVLPFDITPTCIRIDQDWKTGRVERVKLEPRDFKPIRPSPYQSIGSKPPIQLQSVLQSLFCGDPICPNISLVPSKNDHPVHRPHFPHQLVDLPAPGKKSWNSPVPIVLPMKPYSRYTSREWLDDEPPPSPKVREAIFWDAENSDDFVEVTDADLIPR